jgi:hypothetical protein
VRALGAAFFQERSTVIERHPLHLPPVHVEQVVFRPRVGVVGWVACAGPTDGGEVGAAADERGALGLLEV